MIKQTFLLLLLSLSVFACNLKTDTNKSNTNINIILQDSWVLLPPTKTMSSAYLTILNQGSETDKLLSVQSDVAEVVEMHHMTHENNMMKMRSVNEIDIHSKGSVEMKRGVDGYHLMLIKLKKTLNEGDKVKFTLTFKNAGKKSIIAQVKRSSTKHDAKSKHQH